VRIFNNYGQENYLSAEIFVLNDTFSAFYIPKEVKLANTLAIYKGLETGTHA